MQVASLTTPLIGYPGFQAWASVEHVYLETDVADLLQRFDMQAFSHLKTLRLRAWRSFPFPVHSLDFDMSGVQSLRQLHIEDWSPRSITVAPGCRVYAKWHAAGSPVLQIRQWLQSPCWRASGTDLAALHVKYSKGFGPNGVRALQTILECQHGLERVTIHTAGSLGTKAVPFAVPSHEITNLEKLLRFEISTSSGCWLLVHDTTPLGKTVTLDTKGPLYVRTPVSRSLRWYALEGSSASSVAEGQSSLQWQLANAIMMSRTKSRRGANNPNLEDAQQAAWTQQDCDKLWGHVICPFCVPLTVLGLIALCSLA